MSSTPKVGTGGNNVHPDFPDSGSNESCVCAKDCTENASSDVKPKPETRKKESISRRGLFACTGAIAAMFAIGGASYAFNGKGELLRPPGGQDESHLLGACIKCDRCRSACPNMAVDIAHIEDGFLQARTPIMSFHKGYCDFCEGKAEPLCVANCPTGALVSGFDPKQDKIGVAEVDPDECLLYRGAAGRCSKECVASCIWNALSWSETDGLVVDTDACNGCGRCEYHCPSTSYGSYTGSGKRGINVVLQ
jgi:ferredoxin-type protein NapG